jgi:50S ribosome-binding GTPase
VPSPEESLCGYLRDCCDRATAGLPPGRARETITAVRERLAGELLRVAVGGRLNAGKSTLVNALLGEKLAATDATECTKLVSWFTFGLMNQVVIRIRGGQPVTLPAQPLASAVAAVAAGGQPADEIDVIEVRSSNRILATQYTLVDTPGLDALSGLDDMSLAALAEADVLLYVMPHPGENDEEALTALRDRAGAAGITALSTIGVLSRIDQLGEGTGDPWPVARRHARAYSERLAGLVAAVLPVLGLIAETALGDRFTEADMIPLHALHRLSATDRDTLETALYGADDFLTLPELPLTTAERERLLSLLGIYGIKVALDELDRGCQGAAALLAALRAHSGIDPLLGQLSRQFIGLADPLRARQAIQALDAVTWLGGSPAEVAVLTRLREELDTVRQHPRLRQFALQDSLTDLQAGRWEAPGGVASELSALATGIDLPAQLGLDPSAKPGEIRQLLLTRITAWKLLENTNRSTYRYARAVREYLESLYLSLPPV